MIKRNLIAASLAAIFSAAVGGCTIKSIPTHRLELRDVIVPSERSATAWMLQYLAWLSRYFFQQLATNHLEVKDFRDVIFGTYVQAVEKQYQKCREFFTKSTNRTAESKFSLASSVSLAFCGVQIFFSILQAKELIPLELHGNAVACSTV
jgi:hypothetical protein